MSKLYILCGLPASGKSSFSKAHSTAKRVSRDDIRYSLLKEGEDYFSKERLVMDAFIKELQNHIDNQIDVIADATHLTPKARRRVLSRLKLSGVELIAVDLFNVPFHECLRRNALRFGQERVPNRVMQQMHESAIRPTKDEGFTSIIRL